MHAFELKIPPVAVVIIVATLMGLLAHLASELDFSLPLRRILASTLALVGVGVSMVGVWSFKRAETTVNPLKPETTSALVNSGVYRFTRNPMYLGFLMMLLGWAVFLANTLAAIGPPGFVWYMNRFQIIPEERALAARFGEAFWAYAERVRRWL